MENKTKNILERKINNLVTIKELFSGNFIYRIPNYQRGYSWNKEFETLWNDIFRVYTINKDLRSQNKEYYHYTGMITLDALNEADKDNEFLSDTDAFYVVDGQQRLTSIIIILKNFLEYAKEEGISSISETIHELFYLNRLKRFTYSMAKNDSSNQYFEEMIYSNNNNKVAENQYSKNIDKAIKFIKKRLNYYNKEIVQEIFEIIINNLRFNIYFIEEGFDVRVTFETMNNRGKPLTNLELLKNRLMYLSSFVVNKNEEKMLKDSIEKKWTEIYKNLSFTDSKLSDNEYLRAHWILYKGLDKSRKDAYIDDILNNVFSVDNQLKHTDKIYENITNYINSITEYSRYWAVVNEPSKASNVVIEENLLEKLKRLSRLSDIMYLRVCTTAIIKAGENKLSNVEKCDIFTKLERFIFIHKHLNQDKNDMSFLATNIAKLIERPGEYGTDKTTMKGVEVDKESVLRDLEDSIKNYKPDLSIDQIFLEFSNHIKSKTNKYYDWGGLRYFLYQYNESLKSAQQEGKTLDWLQMKGSSIEHILPQTWDSDKPTEYWRKAFEDIRGNDEEAKNIVNSLGNLLLLDNSAENSVLKNYSFPVKAGKANSNDRYTYDKGSFDARKVSKNECWTLESINQRNKDLFKFMYQEWFKEGRYFETEEEFNEIIKKYNMFLYDFQYDSEKFSELNKELKNYDCSSELISYRKESSKAESSRGSMEKIEDYFDPAIYTLKGNSKSVGYNENIFTYRFGEFRSYKHFVCKIKFDKYKYRIRYVYGIQLLELQREELDNEDNREFLTSLEELGKNKQEELLKAFIIHFLNKIAKTDLSKITFTKQDLTKYI